MGFSLKNLYGSRWANRAFSFFSKEKKWQDIEFFSEEWKERIQLMATFIEKGSSVMDLGCGKMWLVDFLPEGCRYVPVDYTKRSPECIVADFNKHEFPGITTDIAFISGCLEYVRDYKWFLTKVTSHADKVILSYCTIDKFPKKHERKSYNWVNHLSKDGVVSLFNSFNFSLQSYHLTKTSNYIFIFIKCGKTPAT